MYIAETLINPLFTDVTFRRDIEGDGSGHNESGGVMSPPPPRPCPQCHLCACRNPKVASSSLRLSSHCRLKWPKSDFFAQMWPISDFLMTVCKAQIRFFSNQAQTTFICGPKSDTYPMFFKATSVWTAMSHFMRFFRHWNVTDVTILCWRRQED